MADHDASLEWLDSLRGYYDNTDTSPEMEQAELVLPDVITERLGAPDA